MNNQEKNACLKKMSTTSDESDKTSKSPLSLSDNITYHTFNNLDSQLVSERNSYRTIDDSIKYFELQRLFINQTNSLINLKINEYENALVERDYTMKSLHTDMLNSQNNNHVLNNKYKAIIEKTNSVSDTCISLNTNFTGISEHLNRLEDSVKNVKIRQKEIMNIVDQTTKNFQEKICSISDNIDHLLKQMNLGKTREEDLEALKNEYSLQLASYKVKSEEYSKEINTLKSKIDLLLEKNNDINIKLNEEKETASNIKNNFKKELKEVENQNTLISNKYESINVKYEEILVENQSLKNELLVLKTSLNNKENEFDMQKNIIEKQTELLNNLKVTEESYQMLIDEKDALEQRNKDLEKINTDLMENIKSNKVLQSELNVKETKIKDMHKNYDDLLKMHEDEMYDVMEELKLQKESENKAQIEAINLRQEVETHNNTIMNLQKKLNASKILTPKLQSTIDNLNVELVNANQKLQDAAKEHASKRSELLKEKNELENQNIKQLKDVEKLKYNYVKYKSKTKKFYTEIMKLRNVCLRLKLKKVNDDELEVIDLMNNDESDTDDNSDKSVVEFHDPSVSNINTSLQCVSNKINRIPNISTLKRFSSSKEDTNIKTKKNRTSIDISDSHVSIK